MSVPAVSRHALPMGRPMPGMAPAAPAPFAKPHAVNFENAKKLVEWGHVFRDLKISEKRLK